MRALVVVALLLASCETRGGRCERGGGRWVAYDCRDVEEQTCLSVNVGLDVTVPVCGTTTVKSCRHLCTVAEAAARP